MAFSEMIDRIAPVVALSVRRGGLVHPHVAVAVAVRVGTGQMATR
jgi:hypothetical protein